jgi:hypothetical protein
MRGTFPAHHIFLEFITLIINVNEYKSRSSPLGSLLLRPSWDQMPTDDPVFEHFGLFFPKRVLGALAEFREATICFLIPVRQYGTPLLLLDGL